MAGNRFYSLGKILRKTVFFKYLYGHSGRRQIIQLTRGEYSDMRSKCHLIRNIWLHIKAEENTNYGLNLQRSEAKAVPEKTAVFPFTVVT
jgi:hypothetical protein